MPGLASVLMRPCRPALFATCKRVTTRPPNSSSQLVQTRVCPIAHTRRMRSSQFVHSDSFPSPRRIAFQREAAAVSGREPPHRMLALVSACRMSCNLHHRALLWRAVLPAPPCARRGRAAAGQAASTAGKAPQGQQPPVAARLVPAHDAVPPRLDEKLPTVCCGCGVRLQRADPDVPGCVPGAHTACMYPPEPGPGHRQDCHASRDCLSPGRASFVARGEAQGARRCFLQAVGAGMARACRATSCQQRVRWPRVQVLSGAKAFERSISAGSAERRSESGSSARPWYA